MAWYDFWRKTPDNALGSILDPATRRPQPPRNTVEATVVVVDGQRPGTRAVALDLWTFQKFAEEMRARHGELTSKVNELAVQNGQLRNELLEMRTTVSALADNFSGMKSDQERVNSAVNGRFYGLDRDFGRLEKQLRQPGNQPGLSALSGPKP